MTDIVYGGVATPPTSVNATEPSKSTRKSLLRRFYDRLVESRLAYARQELARYAHLAPQNARMVADFSRAREDRAPDV
jgi:hypothetical protein